jgi:aspartate carbamoyltransferase catalytic subunit
MCEAECEAGRHRRQAGTRTIVLCGDDRYSRRRDAVVVRSLSQSASIVATLGLEIQATRPTRMAMERSTYGAKDPCVVSLRFQKAAKERYAKHDIRLQTTRWKDMPSC